MSVQAEKSALGAIRAPVALLWENLDQNERYRIISLQAAADPEIWAEALEVDQRVWLRHKIAATALYGEQVLILEEQRDWLRVALVSALSKTSPEDCLGWVLAGQVSRHPDYLLRQEQAEEVVVSSPAARLYRDPSFTQPGSPLSYQVRLPLLEEQEVFYKALLPDGKAGYLAKDDSKRIEDLTFSGGNIVVEARQFLGVKCLWGGACAYGFDSAGLVFRIYQSQGISMPRRISRQLQAGREIAGDRLHPGDLLFFAAKHGTGRICHVGIFSGGATMIHAPEGPSVVKEEAFRTGCFSWELIFAKRISLLPDGQSPECR